VAVDATGDLWVADARNHRVRRVNAATRTITTFAGTGEEGFSGDSARAVESPLAFPQGLAVDEAGNVYVADTRNYRVRRITAATRTISTLAGTGERGVEGDGGPAIDARFSWPQDVAVDSSGKVYVSDRNRVRVVRPAVLISVPLGSSGMSATFEVSPEGLLLWDGRPVLDGGEVTLESGDVYVLTRNSESVVLATYLPDLQSVELASGVSVMLARSEDGTWRIGDTVIRNGSLHTHEGQEYVLEFADGRWRTARYAIRSVAGTTAVSEGIAGSEASLYQPPGVTTDSAGNVYVADQNRIRRIDVSGVISTFAGTGEWGYSGDGGPATAARLHLPSGMASDGAGNLYVADWGNHRIRKIDATGTITTTEIGRGRTAARAALRR